MKISRREANQYEVMQLGLMLFGITLAMLGCSKNSGFNSGGGSTVISQAPSPLLSPSPVATSAEPHPINQPLQPLQPNSSPKSTSSKQIQLLPSKSPNSTSSPSLSSKLDSTKPNQKSSTDQPTNIPSFREQVTETQSGESAAIAGGAYVNVNSLIIRDSPGGKAIGKMNYGQRVALTGAEQYAEGRQWAQIASGGWVASQYLSYK